MGSRSLCFFFNLEAKLCHFIILWGVTLIKSVKSCGCSRFTLVAWSYFMGACSQLGVCTGPKSDREPGIAISYGPGHPVCSGSVLDRFYIVINFFI